MATTRHEARRFLGKRVRVTLDRANFPPAVIVEGQLLGLGDEGTFEILEDDGFVHYCWPMLRIEEVRSDHEANGLDAWDF